VMTSARSAMTVFGITQLSSGPEKAEGAPFALYSCF
jgi:hypothetical protein